MSELKCGAGSCVFNFENLCCKGEICVGGTHAKKSGDTRCESFLKNREGVDVYTSSISHPSRNVSIDCEADRCIYNDHYKCTAEHVDIDGLSGRSGEGKETNCGTFRERSR